MSAADSPPSPTPPPTPPEEAAPSPEDPSSAWPDTLIFWVAVTFAVILISAGLCAGGYKLFRALI